MTNKQIKTVSIIATIVGIIFLFFFIKKNPQVIQSIAGEMPKISVNVETPEGAQYNIILPGYTPTDYVFNDTPHDFTIPAIELYSENRSNCNFCLESRVEIAPAGNPAPFYAPVTVMPQPPTTWTAPASAPKSSLYYALADTRPGSTYTGLY